jgi:poly-beta-1,6-N-acetyl-D-glucosamine synthase
MEILFWAAVFVVAYVYVGYPALLAVWAHVGGRTPRKREYETGTWPSISIVVAARNEGARLPDRLTNLLQVPYPGRREIIVVSDGSTDATVAALAPFGDRVKLLTVPAGGKPLALNAGVREATGEILVFADARQRFDDRALLELVANFADPQVGGASGELVLDCEVHSATDSTVGEGVGLYWKYEKWLRRRESLVWSTLGATGAIYALRRELWQPLPPETLLDDVLAPMRVVLGGRRIVFEDRALAYDAAAPDAAAEARRKTRTLAGNYQILAQAPRLLVPIANPVWLQYMSHKVGRLLVPWALVSAFVSSLWLAAGSWFFALAFGAQLAFYGLAAVGAWLDAREAQQHEFQLRSGVAAARSPRGA